jgi:hypothetical protein
MAAQEVSSKIAYVSRDAKAVNDCAEGVQKAIAGVSSNISNLRSVLISVVRTSTEEVDRGSEPHDQIGGRSRSPVKKSHG